jgi:hypothetical protein
VGSVSDEEQWRGEIQFCGIAIRRGAKDFESARIIDSRPDDNYLPA